MTNADQHQLKILKDTVKNPDLWLLGGPTLDEAEQTLKEKFGYSEKEIDNLR